jgi:hypothetical protein
MEEHQRGLLGVLRKEIGLSAERAKRGVEEYRRFLFLAATTDERVVASPFVEGVWRVHRGDARAYESMLGEVLRRPIAAPTRWHSAVDPDYRRTLARYRQEFGEAPFPKAWPSRLGLVLRRGAQVLVFGLMGVSALSTDAPLLSIGAFLGGIVCGGVWYRFGPWEPDSPGHEGGEPGEEPT